MAAPSTLGFVGLGQMGGPMAANIAKGGAPLACYDKVSGLAPEGASEAAGLDEVVERSETVFLSLPDGGDVVSVASGIASLPGAAGKVVVDMSTIGPAAAKEAAAVLAKADATYIDAPVSGGRRGALDASITVIWAGPKAEFERHKPVLDLFSGNAFHVGEVPGQGQAVKLLNNFLSGTAMAASSEAVLFGLAHGVDMKTIIDVVKVSTGNNTAISDKFPNRILPGTYDAGFFVELISKDVRLYNEFAEQAGVSNLVGSRVAEVWNLVEDALPPRSDFTRVFQTLEGRSKR